VDGGHATPFAGDFEYYAAKRGLDIEARGATEGRATPRGLERKPLPPSRASETAAEASARRRTEAEQRNQRYRRTHRLREALARVEHDQAETDAELSRLSQDLADPATYADGGAVRDLIQHHNSAQDRIVELAKDRERLARELANAEADAGEITARTPR